MTLTSDMVLNAACSTLKLDFEVLTAEGRTQGNNNYRDGRLICAHILRRRVIETKVIQGTISENTKRGNPKRAKMEVEKPITYKRIGDIFKRKACSVMASELKCNDLLLTDPEFKAKYETVINLLDSNASIV